MIRGFVDPEIRGFGRKNTTSKLVNPGINLASVLSFITQKKVPKNWGPAFQQPDSSTHPPFFPIRPD